MGLLNIKAALVRLIAHEVNIKAKRKKGSFAALRMTEGCERMTGEESMTEGCAQDDAVLKQAPYFEP